MIWSTRFSLDAIGTNFRDAHLALSRGAANYFGTNLDGELGKTKTHLGEGKVELGDVQVVDTVEEGAQQPSQGSTSTSIQIGSDPKDSNQHTRSATRSSFSQ